VIIDCLEFNRDFRLLDPWDELAFLALECEHLGCAAAGQWVLETYGNATGDVPAPSIIHFYTSYRAALRARLAIGHLGEPVNDAPKWRRRARRYLDLAEAHIAQSRSVAGSDL
jgi:aminoglycoside phosphotransferase family enzyme